MHVYNSFGREYTFHTVMQIIEHVYANATSNKEPVDNYTATTTITQQLINPLIEASNLNK